MRLVIKQNDKTVDEFQFAAGPIYIGRHVNSQVILPNVRVSRQHAVIFSTPDAKWMIEDLDSANKTYLNNKAVHKAEIKTGDRIRIADFIIEIDLETAALPAKQIHLEDTLMSTQTQQPQIIVRKPDTEHAPDIRLPAARAKDFVDATEAICRANGLDEALKVLLTTLLRQFSANRAWCALRDEPKGPMTSHTGRTMDGRLVQPDDIKLNDQIKHAVENGQFLLLAQVPAQTDSRIRSAMIAPITSAAGCFGVIYVDNDIKHEQYSLSDLDYLMLLAVHTAAILENF